MAQSDFYGYPCRIHTVKVSGLFYFTLLGTQMKEIHGERGTSHQRGLEERKKCLAILEALKNESY